MKKLFAAVMIMGLGLSAHAQFSRFLEAGKSGLGFRAICDKSEDYYGFGGTIGGSFKGKVDVELTYSYDMFDEVKRELVSDNAVSSYYQGIVTWWLFKKQPIPGIDINLGIVGGFDALNYSNYRYLDVADNDIAEDKSWANGLLGFASSINFRMTDTWFLQPSLCMRFEAGKDIVNNNGKDKVEIYSGFTSNIGLSLLKRFENGNTFYISADQYLDTYGSRNWYIISLGYALSLTD